MTYGQIETKARTLVNDTQTPYRFDTATVNDFAVAAVRHLRNVNPAEKYGPTGLLDETIPEVGADDDDIRIDPRHEEAVVLYVAHMLYRLDVTDTVNLQTSETFRTRAEALMQL